MRTTYIQENSLLITSYNGEIIKVYVRVCEKVDIDITDNILKDPIAVKLIKRMINDSD